MAVIAKAAPQMNGDNHKVVVGAVIGNFQIGVIITFFRSLALNVTLIVAVCHGHRANGSIVQPTITEV